MLKNNPQNIEIKKKYDREGYFSPLNIFSEDEIDHYINELNHIETFGSDNINSELRYKAHLVFPFLAQIVRNPKILDVIETILGPNLLVWGSGFFIKEPESKTFVSWHQDSNYWGLSHNDVTTAWVAFSKSNIESGCMKVIPGSHKLEIMIHNDKPNENNLLSRGQTIINLKHTDQTRNLILKKGQMSLHHIGIAHSSDPNTSNYRRTGFAIRYIPTYIRQTIGDIDSATLVRGSDKYNHFLNEPIPSKNFDQETNNFRMKMWENAKNYFLKK